jgi:ABC-2 type transport system permease protein
MNWNRVAALVLRYTYLYRRSAPRLIETIFWPMMDLLVWGFLTVYLTQLRPGQSSLVTFLLGAMIFWDILYRAAQGVTLSFLEDIWSRNVLNVWVAPVRMSEFLAATYLVGLLKTALIVVVLSLSAALFYDFEILSMGWSLAPLFGNILLMGWAVGMFTTALIVRFGMGAEALAWGVPFLIQPLSAVFYPVSVLPEWIQPISLCIPSTHVFEGMREVLQGGPFPYDHLWKAAGLNAIFFALCGAFFVWMFRQARDRGYLAKLGTQ